jgi:dienelactone hydrolase
LPQAEILGQTEVGPGVGGLVSDGRSVWVSDTLGVKRIDAAGGIVVLSASAGANAAGAGADTSGTIASGVATDGGATWVGSYSEDRVAPLDTTTGKVALGRAVVVPGPSGMVMAADALWVSSGATGQLFRIDPSDGRVIARIDDRTQPGLISTDAGSIWTVDADGTGVTRIDPKTNAVDHVSVQLASPTALGIGAGAVWVGTADGTLARIDPATGQVKRVQVEPRPGLRPSITGIAVGDRTIWVTGSLAPGTYVDFLTRPGFVGRLDRSTLALVDAWQLGAGSSGGVLVGGAFWTALGFTSVVRIAADDSPAVEGSPAAVSTEGPFDFEPDVTYAEPDGLKSIPLDIYAPASAERAPVIILVPGAPGPFQTRRYLAPLAAALASRGALVLDIDYRSQFSGATSLGDSLSDVACAITWARKHAAAYGGNPSMIVAAGHSVGSQLVLWEVLGAPQSATCAGVGALPDRVVAIAGPDVMDQGDTVPAQTGPSVPLRIVIGALDQADLATRLESVLHAAGYDATLDIVPDADHHSIIDARDSVPTLHLILDATGASSR